MLGKLNLENVVPSGRQFKELSTDANIVSWINVVKRKELDFMTGLHSRQN